MSPVARILCTSVNDDELNDKIWRLSLACRRSALKSRACRRGASCVQAARNVRLGPRSRPGHRHEQRYPELARAHLRRVWRRLWQLLQRSELRQAVQQDGWAHLLPGLGQPLQMTAL